MDDKPIQPKEEDSISYAQHMSADEHPDPESHSDSDSEASM